jgi:hypothetical protein
LRVNFFPVKPYFNLKFSLAYFLVTQGFYMSGFRVDIQALRGYAVFLVLIYHAELGFLMRGSLGACRTIKLAA